jgi:hypothetical protein
MKIFFILTFILLKPRFMLDFPTVLVGFSFKVLGAGRGMISSFFTSEQGGRMRMICVFIAKKWRKVIDCLKIFLYLRHQNRKKREK